MTSAGSSSTSSAEAAAEVARQLSNHVHRTSSVTLRASDVMSTDLFSIDLTYTVERAHRELVERGFSAAVVLSEEGKDDLARLDADDANAPVRKRAIRLDWHMPEMDVVSAWIDQRGRVPIYGGQSSVKDLAAARAEEFGFEL